MFYSLLIKKKEQKAAYQSHNRAPFDFPSFHKSVEFAEHLRMSVQWELSSADRELYVEQIVQVGLVALQSRGRGGHQESEASTRKEAEQVVQVAYASSSTPQELMLKISKMVRKLDPYAAVNSFQQNRPLLQRLLEANNPIIQRDKVMLQVVLGRGSEPSVLVQVIDEVMKANSLAKKYKALEADTLLVKLVPLLENVRGAVSVGSADLLFRVCTEEVPKIMQCLSQLALTPAIRAHIATCLVHLSGDTVASASALEQNPVKLAVVNIQCETLLRIVMTLIVSARECAAEQSTKQGVCSVISVLRPAAAPVLNVGIPIKS